MTSYLDIESKKREIMRVGVIGVGIMGQIHARIYHDMPDVYLVGVVDNNPKVLTRISKKYGVSGYQSVAELLTQEIDAVSVCVPTKYHFEIGCQVIDGGIPLLIEKPLAINVEEGEILVKKARRSGVQLMVGHVERYNPVVPQIKEILKGEEVISIQITRVGPFPPRVRDIGVITDLGAHDIDLIHFITQSDFKHVFAVSSKANCAHEDSALVIAEMENGVLAQITMNWLTPFKQREIQIATKGRYIKGDLITCQVKEYRRNSNLEPTYQVREWPLFSKEPLYEELYRFITAVHEGKEVPITGEDGLYVLKVIEKILSSVPLREDMSDYLDIEQIEVERALSGNPAHGQ